MRASPICPACNQPGTLDEVCPNCGRNTGLPPHHGVLGSKVVDAIQSRANKEWRLACETHSQVSLPLQEFARKYCGLWKSRPLAWQRSTVSTEQLVGQLLDNLKWSDLFLTTACASGDSQAWESFRRQYHSVIHLAALKTSTNSSEAAELGDTLLTDLFLPHDGRLGESKIAQYHGLGSLEGWIKVVVHRMAIDQIRLHQRDVPMEELELELPSNSSQGKADEIVAERDAQRAREMVSHCLTTAMEQLCTRERLVLNLYYLEGVNLKGIGQFLKAHESTASRLLDR